MPIFTREAAREFANRVAPPTSKSRRFILEGTWTGYVSRQSRVVHREVITAKRAALLKGLHKIVYTDGTALLISLRAAKPREKVVTINSYGELIRDAEAKGGNVVLVAELAA